MTGPNIGIGIGPVETAIVIVEYNCGDVLGITAGICHWSGMLGTEPVNG